MPIAQYNGNIASQSWGSSTAANSKSYTYIYDNLNRLLGGTSQTITMKQE
jgi:transcription initiation factor TFIID subunit TAF12